MIDIKEFHHPCGAVMKVFIYDEERDLPAAEQFSDANLLEGIVHTARLEFKALKGIGRKLQ